MRKILIAGNWKMNKTAKEAELFVKKISAGTGVDVLVCPNHTCLEKVAKAKNKAIFLGGQNMHFEESGAFTGETSAAMLKDVGCSHVILGHSERRHIFGEDDSLINKKVKKALSSGLIPVLCVGETKEQRLAGKTNEVNISQLVNGLEGVGKEEMKKVIIAYEPVWAIGTGLTASPQQAQEVHHILREELSKMYGKETGENTRILYGGSMKASNVKELLECKDIDGGLIGGASLTEEFNEMIRIAETIKK